MWIQTRFELEGSIVDHVRFLNNVRGWIISKSVFGFPICSVGFSGYQVEMRGSGWARGIAFFEVVDMFGNGDRDLVLIGEREVLIQTLPTTRLEASGLEVDFEGGGRWLIDPRESFKIR